MLIGVLFWILMLTCCGLAAGVGGSAGRWGAGLFVGAALTSVAAVKAHQGWGMTNDWLFLVDLAHFVALYILAVRSHRYWPIWSAGFQLLAVLTNVAILLSPGTPPKLYRALENAWSLPMLVTMAAGVWIDFRAARVRA